MKRLIAILSILLAPILSLATSQNSAQTEVGVVQGIVTRAGTTEPLSNVQVTLEGGVDPQVMLKQRQLSERDFVHKAGKTQFLAQRDQ
jgi:hypothetical protein